ncbi:unnamed protein product [Amoebophrya sp. A120]|nr:unnamed protein product [Amoebophrya sp. A120]|eukprot:GSA120T00006746001.1
MSSDNMKTIFESRFTIANTSLHSVVAFHQNDVVAAFPQLAPPLTPVEFEPPLVHKMEENALLKFTLWIGYCLLPVRWVARHFEVSENGFTDEVVRGPVKYWRHRHAFRVVDKVGSGQRGDPSVPIAPSSARASQIVEVHDKIEYEHFPLLSYEGIVGRLLINRVSLFMLFKWRGYATRRAILDVEGDIHHGNESALEKPLLAKK